MPSGHLKASAKAFKFDSGPIVLKRLKHPDLKMLSIESLLVDFLLSPQTEDGKCYLSKIIYCIYSPQGCFLPLQKCIT